MQEKLRENISRLLHFEPVQYIFGHTLWNGLDLKVTPATLIPRPETAELIEQISNLNSRISNLKSPVKVLDIGTGSGCIAIALKKAHPQWQVTGMDISAEAIEVARENAQRNGVEVNFIQADIFSDGIGGIEHFDIVVSNPPYIPETLRGRLQAEVEKEPALALFAGADGLDFYRRIAQEAPTHLSIDGKLLLEIGDGQGDAVAALLSPGFQSIALIRDLNGLPRVIRAERKSP